MYQVHTRVCIKALTTCKRSCAGAIFGSTQPFCATVAARLVARSATRDSGRAKHCCCAFFAGKKKRFLRGEKNVFFLLDRRYPNPSPLQHVCCCSCSLSFSIFFHHILQNTYRLFCLVFFIFLFFFLSFFMVWLLWLCPRTWYASISLALP